MNLADDIEQCKDAYGFKLLGDLVGSTGEEPHGYAYEMGCVLWLRGLQLGVSSVTDAEERKELQALFDQNYAISEKNLGKDPFVALEAYARFEPSVRQGALA